MTPCSDAMIKDVLTVTPDTTVHDALAIFEKNDIRSVPVVSKDGNLLGLFGLKHVLLSLLPKSVTMEGGLTKLDFVVGAAPGIAKRLGKIQSEPIENFMEKNPDVLQEDTPTWEALRVIALYGSPIPIVKENSGEFIGMISRQSLLKQLETIKD